MIKPAITPRRITGNATTGIISAARSGVRNIRGATETISNAPDVTKEQRFGINYVGFFGSTKVGKDLKKSMKTIRDSVGSTFGIAKSLKESVTKGAGVFGFIGKLIGGAAMALPIFALLGIPLLKGILGILAVGGIAGLLSTFGGQIIDFVRDKASGFTKFIKEVISEFFIGRRTSTEFQNLREVSQRRIDRNLNLDTRDDRQEAVVEANQNEIKFLRKEKDNYVKNNSIETDANYKEVVKAYEDRIKELSTGKLDLRRGIFGSDFLKGLDVPGKLATNLSEQRGIFGGGEYIDASREEKFNRIRDLLSAFGDKEDINRAKLLYSQELKKGTFLGKKLGEEERAQAEDILKYLEVFGDDPLGDISPTEKENFLRQLSQGSVKSLSKTVLPLESTSMPGDFDFRGGGGGGNNLAVLPMGNNSNQSLARNDTGPVLTSGPTMKIHPNFDVDNFVAPINMANFNVV